MARTKPIAVNGNVLHPEIYHDGHAQCGSPYEDEATDLDRWRLLNQRGRQTWHYLETDVQVKEWPQTIADRYHLGLPLVYISCYVQNHDSLD